ncbi:tetratricopeptide repeat protein [Dokdonella sp.]|uniref:tetratricopeptide repeat protein n=1 Tax=Dokdonella sp. TaxID=2291710 RepID=UPI0025BDB41F|nr:tetratricopeptide repeat protein [Dokdonella sp.]
MQLERLTCWLLVLVLVAGCAAGGGNSSVRQAKELDPENPKAKAAALYTDLGQKYLAQGKLESALENLNKALAADSNHADAHTVIAVLYARIGQNDKAEAALSASRRTAAQGRQREQQLRCLPLQIGSLRRVGCVF